MAPSTKRWLKLLLNMVVIAIVALFVARAVGAGYRQLLDEGWSLAKVRPGWGGLAMVLYALGQLPSGLFWHRVLWTLGQQPRLYETLRAFFIGHLGKYVPGKAMVIVLRAGLIGGARVSRPMAAISVFYETLTTMSVGACMAAAILVVLFRDEHTSLQWAALALMVAAGLPTFPPLVRRLVRWLGVGRLDPLSAQRLEQAGFRMLAFGWAVIPVCWILVGLSLWAALRAGGYESADPLPVQWAVTTAAAALAVVAGFASLVPGGLFVREAALLVLLTPTFGEAAALVSAVLARLIWLLSEVLVSGILYVCRPGPAQPANGPPPVGGQSPAASD